MDEQRPPDGAPTPPWVTSARMAFGLEDLRTQRRRLLRELEQHHLPESTAYDAALVLGELVSNAVRHAEPLDGGGLAVTWGQWDGYVHIEVTDGGGGTVPEVRPLQDVTTEGRGLAIVSALAAAWGIRADADTMTVWADLPVRVTSAA